MPNTYLRLVPWRNREEWMKVYNDAYSSDVFRQSNACDTMETWLLMRKDVPPGVECTLNILSAMKQENKKSRQLQLILSTAVLRVVNMLCDNARVNGKETIFSIAQFYNIPKWVVDLRHDVSHGSSLPDITTLKRAGKFLLTWLREYYWEVESKDLKDIVLKRSREEACKHNVTFYIKTYIELMDLQKQFGNIKLNEIPGDILFRVLDINLKSGFSCAVECLPWINHAKDGFAKELSKEEIPFMKISIFINRILLQLLDYFTKQSFWQFDSLPLLVAFMEDYYYQHKDIAKEIWAPVLQKLNKSNLLDRLIEILCEKDSLIKEASSFWFDEITKSALKRHLSDKLKELLSATVTFSNNAEEQALARGTMLRKRLSLADCNNKEVQVRLFSKVEMKHSDLKDAIRLSSSVQYIIENCSIFEVIKSLTFNPDKRTITRLQRLFLLIEPAISESKQTNLINLVLIHLGQKAQYNISPLDHFQIKTIFDLQKMDKSSNNIDSNKMDCRNSYYKEFEVSDDKSDSTMDNERFICNFERSNWDFSNCPLGITPWQLEGVEYYHKPFDAKTAVSSYIFPLSIPRL